MAEFDANDFLHLLKSPEEQAKKTTAAPDKEAFSKMAASGASVGKGSSSVHNVFSTAKGTKVEGYSYSLNTPTYSNAISNDLSHSENLFGLAAKLEGHLAAHESALNSGLIHPALKEQAAGHVAQAYGKLADFYDSNSASQQKHLKGEGYTQSGFETVLPRGRRQVADIVGSEAAVGSVGHMRDAVVHLQGALSHLKAASKFSNLGITPEVEGIHKDANKELFKYQKHVEDAGTPLLEALKNEGHLSTTGTVDLDEVSTRPAPLRLPTSPQTPRSASEVTLGEQRVKVGRPLYMSATMRPDEDYKAPDAWSKPSQQRQEQLDEEAKKAQAAKFESRTRPFVPTPASSGERESQRQDLSRRVADLRTPRDEPARRGAFKQQQADAAQRREARGTESGPITESPAFRARIAAQDEITKQTIAGHIASGRYKDAAVLHLHSFGTNEFTAPVRHRTERKLIVRDPAKYLTQQGYDIKERPAPQTIRGTTRTGANPQRSAVNTPTIRQRETRTPTTATTNPFTPQAESAYVNTLAKSDLETKTKRNQAFADARKDFAQVMGSPRED
jgi:hypothetical protein